MGLELEREEVRLHMAGPSRAIEEGLELPARCLKRWAGAVRENATALRNVRVDPAMGDDPAVLAFDRPQMACGRPRPRSRSGEHHNDRSCAAQHPGSVANRGHARACQYEEERK